MPVRDLMRAINRAKIIEIIRTTGLISRVDLAAESGLSKASVTGITAELTKAGLIIEKQSGEYEGGRRPRLVGLNPDGVYVVGVNLSIMEISVVMMNLAADVLSTASQPLEIKHYSVEEITDLMVKTVQSCMWEGNFARDKISGVGIGVPGPVYANSGVIRFLPNYNWENVNLRDRIEAELGLPCYIDNSSNSLAAAERWFGEGKWQPTDPEYISFDSLIEELQFGNGVIENIFCKAGKILGYGVSHLVALFNPSRIIITGTAVQAGDSLLVPFMQSLANNTAAMSGQVKDLVYIKQWTEEQWARGAGSLVLQELYKPPVSELPID